MQLSLIIFSQICLWNQGKLTSLRLMGLSAFRFVFSLTFEHTGSPISDRRRFSANIYARVDRKRDTKRTWPRRLTVLNTPILRFRRFYDVHSDVCRALSFIRTRRTFWSAIIDIASHKCEPTIESLSSIIALLNSGYRVCARVNCTIW